MQYRTLGKTDIKVSEIGMGCEGFEGKPFKECEQLLDFAMQNNINFFDLYTSNPEVRRNLGSALKKYPRNKFIIQGHLCTIWEDGQYCRTRDIDKIIPSFEQILTLMQIEYVDIGMVHYVDDKNDFDIVMNGPIIEYAKQLKQKGIIKSIGLSTHNTDIALLAAKSGIMDVIMFSINPAYDMLPANEDVNIFFEESTYDRVYEGIDPKREELYQTCQNNGIALTVMKPFAGGLLLDEKQSPFGKAMTPIQCISYCLDRPSVASVLGGMASIDQVKQAVDYCTASEKQRDYSEILANAPRSSFSGHCMYCGHCAPCTVKIDIASVNKYLDLAIAQGFIPETVQNHYDLLEHHAGQCIKCGQCMKNCPFGTNIIEKMEQAEQLFGK